MTVQDAGQNKRAVEALLQPGEDIRHTATAGEALLAVTDRRVAVVEQDRTALMVDIAGLRRIQFDIEKARPATLVIVPEQAEYESQVLMVEPAEYRSVADALVAIGHDLASGVDSPPSVSSRLAGYGQPKRV